LVNRFLKDSKKIKYKHFKDFETNIETNTGAYITIYLAPKVQLYYNEHHIVILIKSGLFIKVNNKPILIIKPGVSEKIYSLTYPFKKLRT
jgi:hypothetical protein